MNHCVIQYDNNIVKGVNLKMRVFSKEKFIESEGYEVYLKCKEWVDICDGKRVTGGNVEGWESHKDWEIVEE